MLTCCVPTQILERVICFDTYKASLARAANNEARWRTSTLRWFCPSLQGGFMQGSWRSCFCRLCEAAGSRSAPLPVWIEGPLHLAELSSVLQWARSLPLSYGKVTTGVVILEPLPVREKIQPLLQARAFPLKWDFSSLWAGSSWLFASAQFSRNPAPVARISPSCFNLTASTMLHQRKLEYWTEKELK